VHHFDLEVKVAKFNVLVQNGDILIDVDPGSPNPDAEKQAPY
jgi:hypothetical protein